MPVPLALVMLLPAGALNCDPTVSPLSDTPAAVVVTVRLVNRRSSNPVLKSTPTPLGALIVLTPGATARLRPAAVRPEVPANTSRSANDRLPATPGLSTSPAAPIGLTLVPTVSTPPATCRRRRRASRRRWHSRSTRRRRRYCRRSNWRQSR